MCDPKKFGWPLFLLPFEVGDEVTVVDINGKEWTGTLHEDGSIRGEPVDTIAPDCTFYVIESEDRSGV